MGDLDYVTRYFGVTPIDMQALVPATEKYVYLYGRSLCPMPFVDSERGVTNSCMSCEWMAAKLAVVEEENKHLWKILKTSVPILSRVLDTAVLWNSKNAIKECSDVIASCRELSESLHSKGTQDGVS